MSSTNNSSFTCVVYQTSHWSIVKVINQIVSYEVME